MKTLKVIAMFVVLFVPAVAQSPIDYFKGTWDIALKNVPAAKISWVVTDTLGGAWLHGEVTMDGTRTSDDRWGVVGSGMRRYAFLSTGSVLELRSGGWKADTLVFTGSMTAGKDLVEVRETIIRESRNRFRAVWERRNEKGMWEIFSDEICTRKK